MTPSSAPPGPVRPGAFPGAVLQCLRLLLVQARAREANLYGVGGFTRDLLDGRVARDIDLTIAGHAVEVGRTVAEACDSGFVVLHEAAPAVARLVVDAEGERWTIDLADLRADRIEDDLRMRDFTVNAVALRLAAWLETGQAVITDPLRGLDDWKARRLHLASPRAITEDAVRALRGVRLAAQFGLIPTPATREALQAGAAGLATAPGERLLPELTVILRYCADANSLLWLQRSGMLAALLPELLAADGCSQPPEHYWDVLRHSFETVVAVETVLAEVAGLANGPWMLAQLDGQAGNGRSRRDTLRLAALLHDVAKPQTRSVEANGRMHFFEHGPEGSEVAAVIGRRMRLSGDEIGWLRAMVAHHLRPGMLRDVAQPSTRAMYRYFRDLRPVGIDTLVLNLADHRAARGPLVDQLDWAQHLAFTDRMAGWQRAREAAEPVVPLLGGDEVMHVFSLSAGPLVGRVLAEVDEAQATGDVTTHDDALEFARRALATIQQATPATG